MYEKVIMKAIKIARKVKRGVRGEERVIVIEGLTMIKVYYMQYGNFILKPLHYTINR
jgi:hypothetical protein